METNVKKGHPVLGIILGIIGIVIAVTLTFFTGLIGGGAALLLGIIAVCLGFSGKHKGGKGVGAIVIGFIAIVLAVVTSVSSVGLMKAIREEAAKRDDVPLLQEYMKNPYLGMLGIATSIPSDEASLQQLLDELQAVNGESE